MTELEQFALDAGFQRETAGSYDMLADYMPELRRFAALVSESAVRIEREGCALTVCDAASLDEAIRAIRDRKP
jgi:hypothetical protein